MEELDDLTIKLVQEIKKDYPKENYGVLAKKLRDDHNMSITSGQVQRIWHSYGNVVFLDKKKSQNPEQIWKSLINYQKKIKSLDTIQKRATIKINENKPIGIAFTSDWHIGNLGSDYERLLQDTNLMAETKGLFVFTLGDEFDNYIAASPAGGQMEAIAPPSLQKELAIERMEKLKGKLLASLLSCHSSWSLINDDFDFAKYAANHLGILNLGFGGIVTISLNKVNYKFGLRHKYPGGISNPIAMHTKWLQNNEWVDVVANAHYHHPFVGIGAFQGKKVHFIRSGSYKVKDRYGEKLGGYEGIPGCPVVVLFPNKNKILAFDELEKGIEYLNYLRK